MPAQKARIVRPLLTVTRQQVLAYASEHGIKWAHDPTNSDLTPEKLAGTMAFMWETRYSLIPTNYASTIPVLQEDYQEVWAGLRRMFGK